MSKIQKNEHTAGRLAKSMMVRVKMVVVIVDEGGGCSGRTVDVVGGWWM